MNYDTIKTKVKHLGLDWLDLIDYGLEEREEIDIIQ